MQAIEQAAADLLARVPSYVWDGSALPIPVDEIADTCLGLLIRDVDDLATAPGAPPVEPGQSLSGLLLPTLGEIWVDAGEGRDWPARRRFTIAHEIGHWCLHRTQEHGVFCRASTVDVAVPRPKSALPPSEEEANQFAAALLMPPALLRDSYADNRDFQKLCETFGASGAAMGRRLHAVIKRATNV